MPMAFSAIQSEKIIIPAKGFVAPAKEFFIPAK